eukprot:12408-Heterococcus_DN1.PRE.1
MQECSRGPPLRVQVAVRIRPPFQEEVLKWSLAPGYRRAFYNAVEHVRSADVEQSVCCTLPDGRQRQFSAHHVFGIEDSAAKVYTSIAAPIVAQVLGGRCGAIIAYGQTGSGKTHTMLQDGEGIVPRALQQLLQHGAVAISLLQIYAENVQDLLAPAEPCTAANSSIVARVIDAHHADASAAAERGLHIRENPTVGFYVEGLRAYVAATLHDANSLIAIGLANRAVAPTSQALHAAQYHCILMLRVLHYNSSTTAIMITECTVQSQSHNHHTDPSGQNGYSKRQLQLGIETAEQRTTATS